MENSEKGHAVSAGRHSFQKEALPPEEIAQRGTAAQAIGQGGPAETHNESGCAVCLETDRLLLRSFVADDLDDLQEIFGDDEVMQNTEPPYNREKTAKFLHTFCIERDPPGGFATVLKATGKIIGYVLFKSIDESDIYEVGWIFNKAYWRRGYAYEVCSALIDYGFTEMKLHKICAEAIDEVKSVALMEKLGMRCEGVQKKHSRANDGTWRDLYWYAILEEEHRANQTSQTKDEC